MPQGPIIYPNGAPEFKLYKGVNNMNEVNKIKSLGYDHFETISDFKWCINNGGEVELEWKGVTYDIAHPNGKILIAEANKEETALWADTVDEVLEYNVGGDHLRDVITKVELIYRTI